MQLTQCEMYSIFRRDVHLSRNVTLPTNGGIGFPHLTTMVKMIAVVTVMPVRIKQTFLSGGIKSAVVKCKSNFKWNIIY